MEPAGLLASNVGSPRSLPPMWGVFALRRRTKRTGGALRRCRRSRDTHVVRPAGPIQRRFAGSSCRMPGTGCHREGLKNLVDT